MPGRRNEPNRRDPPRNCTVLGQVLIGCIAMASCGPAANKQQHAAEGDSRRSRCRAFGRLKSGDSDVLEEDKNAPCGDIWQRARRDCLSRVPSLYGECMARLISTTIRLDAEDVRALKRARAAGHSASELIRTGLRVVASRYHAGRRPPSTRLFESTDAKLGDESELFRDGQSRFRRYSHRSTPHKGT